MYLVGLHIYYKMIHGPHNIKSCYCVLLQEMIMINSVPREMTLRNMFVQSPCTVYFKVSNVFVHKPRYKPRTVRKVPSIVRIMEQNAIRLTKFCGFQLVLTRISIPVHILQSHVLCAVSVVNCQTVTEQPVCYQYNSRVHGSSAVSFVKYIFFPSKG